MGQDGREEPYEEWIVVTDPGMCNRLQREAPAKTFHAVPTMTPCYTMNITTPAKVRDSLLTLLRLTFSHLIFF